MDIEFEKKIIIERDQCRQNSLLRTSSFFTMLQQIASDHAARSGAGEADLGREGLFWAVTNYRAEIYELPFAGDQVTLKTVIGKASHMIFPRYYRLYGEDGRLLAQCSSRWVMVDKEKRRAVSSFGALLSGPSSPWGIGEAGPVKAEPADRHCVFVPAEHHIDRNGHMNNAAYFDMAEEMLGAGIEGMRPFELAAEYRSELLPGTPMTVSIGTLAADYPAEKSFFLKGEAGEALIFRMKLTYAK